MPRSKADICLQREKQFSLQYTVLPAVANAKKNMLKKD